MRANVAMASHEDMYESAKKYIWVKLKTLCVGVSNIQIVTPVLPHTRTPACRVAASGLS